MAPHPGGRTRQTRWGAETLLAPDAPQHPRVAGEPDSTPALEQRPGRRTPWSAGLPPEAAPRGQAAWGLRVSLSLPRSSGTLGLPQHRPLGSPAVAGGMGPLALPTLPGHGGCPAPHLHLHAIEAQPGKEKGPVRKGRQSRGQAAPAAVPGDSRWLAAQGHREAPSRTRSPPAPGHRSRPPRCPHPQGLPDGPQSGPAFRSAQSLHRVVASSTETALPSLTRHRAPCQHTARRHTHVCTGLEATPTRALTRGNREFWRRAPGTRWRPARPRASARAC